MITSEKGKRRGFTIALIGPDGSGKTTLAEQLQRNLPFPVRYVYMGESVASSNFALPTTRLVAYVKKKLGLYAVPEHVDPATLPEPPRRRGAWIRAPLRFANRTAEEWYRQYVTWSYTRKGEVVLFDRHFVFEYEPGSGGKDEGFWDRLHNRLIDAFFPRPDLTICLDAPADVLFARCHEYSIPYLAKRRESFLRQRNRVENFVTVDVTEPADIVEREAIREILSFAEKRWQHESS
jgi:thymidylate kinase